MDNGSNMLHCIIGQIMQEDKLNGSLNNLQSLVCSCEFYSVRNMHFRGMAPLISTIRHIFKVVTDVFHCCVRYHVVSADWLLRTTISKRHISLVMHESMWSPLVDT